KQNRLSQKREKKWLNRLRVDKRTHGDKNVYDKEIQFRRKIDRKIIEKSRFPLFDFLENKGFLNGREEPQGRVEMPGVFSICANYEDSIKHIKIIVASFYYCSGGDLIISFKVAMRLIKLHSALYK